MLHVYIHKVRLAAFTAISECVTLAALDVEDRLQLLQRGVVDSSPKVATAFKKVTTPYVRYVMKDLGVKCALSFARPLTKSSL